METNKMNVLIVDDDPDFTAQYAFEFREKGYEVFTAASRKEAEKVLKTLRPDAAVLDLMMENQDDGFVLAYKIKKAMPETTVVIATAVSGHTGMNFESVTDDEREWIKADAVFTKPVRIEQIIGEIEKRQIKVS